MARSFHLSPGIAKQIKIIIQEVSFVSYLFKSSCHSIDSSQVVIILNKSALAPTATGITYHVQPRRLL